MSNIKLILSSLFILSVIALVNIFSMTEAECLNDCQPSDSQSKQVITTQAPVVEAVALVTESNPTELLQTDEDKGYKSIDENWCDASVELSPKDQVHVMEEEVDWREFIGKAKVHNDRKVYHGDEFYFDNFHVAPYQELPIEELENLAYSGDKWAMVAYIQIANFHKRDKVKEIANRLLVQGTVYHAIEYLTISELAMAKSNLRNKKLDSSADNMINAIAYTMLGLKYYSESGLIAYLGNLRRAEVFQGILHPSKILAGKEEAIKQRYQALLQSLQQKRERQSIFLPEPPNSVKKSFVNTLFIVSYRDEEELKVLNDMKIADDVDLSLSPCLKAMNARFANN